MEDKTKELEAKMAEMERQIAEKDAIIEQKNQDLVGQRKQYKKLADMTQEEKDALSQKEIELQERQEEMERQQEEFQKQQAEIRQKEVTARKEAAIKKLVGDNEEYAEKLRANIDRIKDSDAAFTEDEISKLASDAFNMLGDDRPNPVSEALNGRGSDAIYKNDGGYADTPEGKALADTLGIGEPAPEAKPAAPAPANPAVEQLDSVIQ